MNSIKCQKRFEIDREALKMKTVDRLVEHYSRIAASVGSYHRKFICYKNCAEFIACDKNNINSFILDKFKHRTVYPVHGL